MVLIRSLFNALAWTPLLAAASSQSATSGSGTFTFYTTVTTTISIDSTLTSTTTLLEGYSTTTITDLVTTTVTSYGFTTTSSYFTPRTLHSVVDPTTTETASPQPTATGFTPIISAFPYTAPVVLNNSTLTTTAYLNTSYVYVSSTSTITALANLTTVTNVEPSGTTTVTDYNQPGTVVTATYSSFAACASGSGNFVDHYPYGPHFGPHLGSLDGTIRPVNSSQVQGQVQSGKYTDQESCCNACMSTGLCVGGFFSSQGILGDYNECQMFLAVNGAVCDGSQVDVTIAKSEQFEADNNTFSGYYLFNGDCGQTWPDMHDNYYYFQTPQAQTDLRVVKGNVEDYGVFAP